ncbi:MAG: hypothetical protein AVDCRST_MAG08-1461, partial [uncultured Acetobacteraceae bacterium]
AGGQDRHGGRRSSAGRAAEPARAVALVPAGSGAANRIPLPPGGPRRDRRALSRAGERAGLVPQAAARGPERGDAHQQRPDDQALQ